MFNNEQQNAFRYRGIITGDLNKGVNGGIKNGYYTLQDANSVTNSPSSDTAWCPFIQFDSYSTQMILLGACIYLRRNVGNPAVWTSWNKIS